MNSLKSDEEYRAFIIENLPRVTTLFRNVDISDEDVLQATFEREDVIDLMEQLSSMLNVNCENFNIDKYYPWKSKSIFTKRPDNTDKKTLTLRMLIESAKAGRWLYDE